MTNNNNVLPMIVLAAEMLFEIPVSFSDSEENESSNSEDELNITMQVAKKRKIRTPQRIENYLETIVPNLTAGQFQQHFRVTIETYEQLLQVVGPQLKRKALIGRKTIDVERQLLASIWLLASPDSYRSVGERFNLAKASLSKSFVRVVKTLNLLSPLLIKWPEDNRLQNIERQFYTVARLPNVIGAIDGTYIQIKAPQGDRQSYITRKCIYAYTLQAIAEPSLKFTDVFTGYPGSVSDTRIFKLSDFYRAVGNNTEHYFPGNCYILGDKAYPVLQWCIPPYINHGNLTNENIYFNIVHAKTRQVVERAFALLLGRWRRLKYLDMNCNKFIPATIVACCVLHNICLDARDLNIEEYINEGRHHIIQQNYEANADFQFHADDGRLYRDQICLMLYENRN